MEASTPHPAFIRLVMRWYDVFRAVTCLAATTEEVNNAAVHERARIFSPIC
jgi:hypothetical protein